MAKRRRSRLAGTPEEHHRIADREETRALHRIDKATKAAGLGQCKLAYYHATQAHQHFGSFWSNVAMARENPHQLRRRGEDIKDAIKTMDARVDSCIRSRKRKG